MSRTSTIVLALAPIAFLAGCATPSVPGEPTVPGKHLVYRDTSGAPIRQFDFPNEDLCRRVEAVAGRSARCQPNSIVEQMQAKAMLRYQPPGFNFLGYYRDMNQCTTDTRKLGEGVEMIQPCSAK